MTDKPPVRSPKDGAGGALLVLVALLCLFCCALMLFMPTRSLSVTTVYKGF